MGDLASLKTVLVKSNSLGDCSVFQAMLFTDFHFWPEAPKQYAHGTHGTHGSHESHETPWDPWDPIQLPGPVLYHHLHKPTTHVLKAFEV